MHTPRGWEALQKLGWSLQAPRPKNPRGASPAEADAFKKNSPTPSPRRWSATPARRPVALGHHRFEWLYVTAFVAPATGETVWYLSNGIDKPLFEMMLAAFARETGAGRDRIVLLVLDGAGWHTEPGLAIPEGIRLVYLPPYTPELQPAEHLWPLVDEPIVNRHFETLGELDAILAKRCRTLGNDRNLIAANTNFHWWPTPNAAM